MERRVIFLDTPLSRARAIDLIRTAEEGSSMDLSPPGRTLGQNARLHVMISDAAKIGRKIGFKYTVDQWKALFLQAAGFKCSWLPELEGTGVIPYRRSTAKMSKREISELMDFIESWMARAEAGEVEPC